MRDRRCKTCRRTASANGAPTIVVAVVDGKDVFACAAHAAKHAAPAGDLVVALAQYQDIAMRQYEGRR